MDLTGGFPAAAALHNHLASQQAPITAECFAPAFIPYPRPWWRVPVTPASSHSRQRKIWKRVGVMPNYAFQGPYVDAMRELLSRGDGPRKRSRSANMIPPWGDAKWDARVVPGQQVPDGKWDLVEARVAVSAAKDAETAAVSTRPALKERRVTYPEQRLRWVPRKRHNSRWPIEPTAADAKRMVGDLQPLIEFDVPAASEPIDTAVKVNGEKMRRRSTRRLSRRISVSPSEASHALPPITLPPVKMDRPVLSPTKRCPVSLSPLKVVESPHQSFRISATPVKVVLQSPQASPPEKSPLKASPLIPPSNAMLTPLPVARRVSSAPAPSSTPLIFDQPTPDTVAEPQHETRRRISLHTALRSERRSSGVTRLPKNLQTAQDAPTRRHSFNLAGDTLDRIRAENKNRRKTLDVSLCATDAPKERTSGEHHQTSEVVEVDVKANLDIFGQRPSATAGSPPRPSSRMELREEQAVTDDTESTPLTRESPPPASPSPTTESLTSSSTLPSPTSEIEDEAALCAQDSHNQATGCLGFRPNSDQKQEDESNHCIALGASRTEPNDSLFYTREPEGLSTIFEESSIVSLGMTGQDPTVLQSTQSAFVDAGSSSALTLPALLDRSSEPRQRECEIPRSDSPPAATDRESDEAEDDDVCAAALQTETRSGLSSQPDWPKARAAASPGTPLHSTVAQPQDILATPDAMVDATRPESSGFTPVNVRQSLPRQTYPDSAHIGNDVTESETDSGDRESSDPDDLDDEVTIQVVDEATEALDDDFTLAVVEPSRLENDTLSLRSLHEEDETEMLRNFVTRVAADKNAKAAAAAAALAKKAGRPKRRSGSTGSVTSATGSPMSKSETPQQRQPLGEKSPNSPSPAKKRKLQIDSGLVKDRDMNEEASDEPRLKRRKRRVDPMPEQKPAAIPDDTDSGSGPRRSTRARSTRIALKPAAPSANSIALSMIPVRLPGIEAMDEAALESHLSVAKQRNEDKELAALTRVNTRKNREGSVHPKFVLQALAEDPGWRMRELKEVFDSKEKRDEDGRKSRKSKSVTWSEELVRYQTDPAATNPFKGMGNQLIADLMMDDPEEDEIAMPLPKLSRPTAVEEPAVTKKSTSNVSAATRRSTRSSRLVAPTPVKKVGAIGEKPTKGSGLPKPTGSAATGAATPKAGMATRRSKIAGLGMSVNGTPAPKRRGRPPANMS